MKMGLNNVLFEVLLRPQIVRRVSGKCVLYLEM